MAYISSTFSTSNTYIKYRIYVDLNSQDVVNNTSNVRVRVQAWRTNNYDTYGSGTCYATIDGTNYSQAITSSQHITLNSYTTLFDYTRDIQHNTDGTKTLNLSSYITHSGFTSSNQSYSFALPTIPRASTVTATNADIEAISTININRYSSSFTHKLYYSFGTIAKTLIAENIATTYDFTIPDTFYAEIPNNKNGSCTIYCDTYSGATLIGSSTTTFTASVNETNNKPQITATIYDSNSATSTLTGDDTKFVKFKSNADYLIDAITQNYATVSYTKIQCGAKYDENTVSGTLSAVESGTFTITVTDSRGFTNTKTYTKTLVNYIPLTFNPTLSRVSPTSDTIKITYSGNYFNGSFGVASNTLSVKWRYREKTTPESSWSSYSSLTPTITDNTYGDTAVTLGTSFDYQKTYEFDFLIEDELSTPTVAIQTVAKGVPVFSVTSSTIKINGTNIFDLIYPIGSIYMSVSSTSPATLFGGTWVAWGTGKTVVGIDTSDTDFNTVEKTGGVKEVTLTAAQSGLPAHNHTATVYNQATGSYTGTTPRLIYRDNTTTSWISSGLTWMDSATAANASQAHTNLQPYITCYMWKRTA